MKKSIVVFHNASGMIEEMKALFESENLHMIRASCLEELKLLINTDSIEMILLDLELNKVNSGSEIELIRHIRSCTTVPIIIASTQTSETAKIRALSVGADDYVTVNDSPLVILARIKAQLRRYTELMEETANSNGIYRTEHIEVNDQNHTVIVDGKLIKMTPIEYKILRLLVQEKGRILSIEQIYEKIWNMRALEAGNVIAVHIQHIRKKIEKNPKEPRYIKVVWGLGYKVG